MLCALNGAKGRFFPFLWRYHLESGLYALCYSAYFEPGIEVFVLYWLSGRVISGLLEGGCMWESTREAYINRVGFYDVHKLREYALG